MAAMNRQWLLRKRPEGTIKAGDLELVSTPVPTPGPGQVLVKNVMMSVDPTHRIWMSDKPQYMPCVELNDVMRASTVGIVEATNSDDYAKGDVVVGLGNVQAYYTCDAANPFLNALPPGVKPEDGLGPLSVIIGGTAFHGMHKICKPKKGETVVISAAAGAVGSLAGQLAKLMGARVIGTVGSEAKAKWITEELGFDGAINYKTDDIDAKLKELCPKGIDCYFENTGGPVTEAVVLHFNNNARMALCGLISEYNDQPAGFKNFNMILHRRVTVQGFVCMDHIDEIPEWMPLIGGAIAEGKIKYSLDMQEGLERYIDVVNMLYTGANSGKLILKI